METVLFWRIMNDGFAKGGFDNKIRENEILGQLIKLSPEQIQQFEVIFQEMNQKVSTWGILAAQTVIEGGSSDDRFYYFRCWLISLGKKNFDETLKNPDFFATLNTPFNESYGMMYCQFEELIPMADNAYKIVTNKDEETDPSFPRTYTESLGKFYDSSTEIKGVEWESNSELLKIVPKLCKRYPNN